MSEGIIAGKTWKESSVFVEQSLNTLKGDLKTANAKLDSLIQFKTTIEVLEEQHKQAVSTATKVVVPIVAAASSVAVTIIVKLVFGI